jgi:ribonucleoside-triphosphate reductase
LLTSVFAITHIVKRDGRHVRFDLQKITKAIQNAGRATGEFDSETAEILSLRVLSLAQNALATETPTVEDIQNLVEETLLASPFKVSAKAYILYRDQHARIRELTTASDLEMIDRYLQRSDWKVKENSNMTYSLQGLNNFVASQLSEVYWLHKIYSPEIRQAHQDGDFHIHDLGLLSVYCVGWDLQDLLLSGFKGAPGKVESGPAKHFRAALGQVVNFFYTLQGEAAGAQAFSNFDTLLAPFIRYDNLSYTEVKQAMQEFVFNVNVPTRVGFQTPFTNVTMDLQASGILASQPVIIGGKFQKEVYGDFQTEIAMFNKAFLEVLAEGDAKERVFTFPIPTYNITSDFDWDAPGLDGLWEATAKYGIPYFANFVNADLSPEDARSMCCRLRLDTRKLEKRGGGLFGANPLTGSIGVVTMNLPRLGFESSSEEDFLSRLDRLMDMARDSLETKRKVLEKLASEDLYPYTRYYLRDIYSRRGAYWGNHFSTIGLVGMHEACLNLLGCGIDSVRGNAFAETVLDQMRVKLTAYQEETGHMYNLEATPAEGTSYRLARLDTKKYPEIRASGGDGEPFYTNSTQLPVDYNADIFGTLDLQDSLQARYTGGTVQHIFLGEAAPDPDAVKLFVRTVCQNYKLPYFTLSPTFSICQTHGYLLGERPVCDQCGCETEVYSRVVGYLRPVSQWNAGKQSEFAMRKAHVLETKSEPRELSPSRS